MKWISLFAFLFAFHGTAFADNPCQKDIEAFCKGMQAEHGAIMKCLHEHHNQLSPECRAQGEKMKKEMKGVQEACHEDQQKFCADVKPGKGRIIKCMHEHKAELSEKCKSEMKGMKDMRGKRKAG